MRHLTALAASAAFFMAAAPADAQFKPSRKQQIELGRKAAEEVRKKERVLPSYDERVRLVRKIGEQLEATLDQKNADRWDFTFDVVDSKKVNAFALPGGPMFIYSGLLDKLETQDQLAGVLGHEMAHVYREHWARQYEESQKRGLLLGVLLGVTRAGNVARTGAGIFDLVQQTKYSRSAETQADDVAFASLVRTGYNPTGMADVFRMFQKMKKGGNPLPFLASHPTDDARIKRIEKKITASNQTFPRQKPLTYDREYSTHTPQQFRWWRIQ